MKKNIQPNYEVTKVVCNSCNTTYTIGSTVSNMKVELCSNCHPFYTGKQVLVDTDNLVDKFNRRKENAKNTSEIKSKKEKRSLRNSSQQKQALTLRDMLNNIK